MNILRALVKAVVSQMEAILSRTSLTATAFDVSEYEGSALVTLTAGAATAGTNPTLDVKLQHCDTENGVYEDITGATFAQVTDTALVDTVILDLNAVKQFVKAVATYGGTSTPTFPFGLQFTGIKKYS